MKLITPTGHENQTYYNIILRKGYVLLAQCNISVIIIDPLENVDYFRRVYQWRFWKSRFFRKSEREHRAV